MTSQERDWKKLFKSFPSLEDKVGYFFPPINYEAFERKVWDYHDIYHKSRHSIKKIHVE